MLSYTDSLLFRPQTDEIPTDSSCSFDSFAFLPANFYPIQSPGYTAHWNRNQLRVIERSDEIAKIVIDLDVTKEGAIDKIVTFDCLPKRERRKFKRAGGSGKGIIGNLTGWFSNWGKRSPVTRDEETIEIVKVLPLMLDKTLFDLILVTSSKKKSNESSRIIYGFTRIRELMTGNFRTGGRIDKIDGFIPALDHQREPVNFVVWKHFLFAISPDGFNYIDLGLSESEWICNANEGLGRIDKLILCEDKVVESGQVILLLLNIHENTCHMLHLEITGPAASLKYKRIHQTLKLTNPSCGYIENGNVHVIQDTNLYQIPLIEEQEQVQVSILNCPLIDPVSDLVYLFPWRQDFKVSALIFYLTRSRNEYRITVLSITAHNKSSSKSETILESDWFKSESEIVGLFASSSLELFLLDRRGNVTIYSGLLLSTDWPWRHQLGNAVVPFEFSSWFNILGEFPFKPAEYYQTRRESVKVPLFIDDLLKEELFTFPPVDWKGLGQACLKLKDDKIAVILYYLLAAKGTTSVKLSSFYQQYALYDKQVAAVEIAVAADHSDYKRAVKMFCTRKLDESVKINYFPKLVKMLSEDCWDCESVEELNKFTLFASGRIISLDFLFNDTETFKLILAGLVKGNQRSISSILEWIKGLFAWLRPDERCALIPVAILHQTLLRRLLDFILNIENNSEFRRLGHEFADAPFDPDSLSEILGHLRSSCGDRSAWLITMICASRGRLHRFLLDFDFTEMVSDPEILTGIESIKNILRPLVNEADYYDTLPLEPQTYSPVIVPGTPQNQTQSQQKRSNSSLRLSSNHLVNIYAQTPSSPISNNSLNASIPRSPTFTPRHYPSKKPTSLLSSTASPHLAIDEEADPFRADLLRFGGGAKRSAIEEIIKMDEAAKVNGESVTEAEVDVVMLTKSTGEFVKPVKRRRKN